MVGFCEQIVASDCNNYGETEEVNISKNIKQCEFYISIYCIKTRLLNLTAKNLKLKINKDFKIQQYRLKTQAFT